MTNQAFSAGSIQAELAQMAWEEVGREMTENPDTVTLLQLHIRKMSEILSDPIKYRNMWERVKRGAQS